MPEQVSDRSWPAFGEASADPIAEFARDGVAALGPALDLEQLETVRAAFAEAVDAQGVAGGYARIVHDAWRSFPALAGFLPQLGAMACAAVNLPELVLFHEHLLFKPPGGDDMAWHQDFSYLPIDRAGGLTLWIALDDISPENGCIYYLPGTHQLGERRAAWGLLGDDDPRALLPALDVADEPGMAGPTAAGCAVAHHEYVWHRSPANASTLPRRAWALSFVVPDARWSPRHSPHPRSAVSARLEGQALEDDLPRVYRAG